MQRRFLTIPATAAALMAAIVLMPKPAAAQQEQSYYTYVSEWAVPRAQWGAFQKQVETVDVPELKKLVADGTLVDWGSEVTRVHTPGGYTHAEWFTATSRANLLKALEMAWKTATNASFVAATKHEDYFLHTIAHGGKTESDATGYLRVSFYQAKRGDSGAFRDLLLNDVKAVFDSAVADGTLVMYNIDEQAIHTAAPGAYNLALFFPNGAAMDKFFSDLAMRSKAHPAIGRMFGALTVSKDHRDSLGRVVAFEHK